MESKMKKVSWLIKSIYFHNYIENGLFIIVLAFYPLMNLNQGLEVADSTYSLGNFQYFDSANGIWMVATYLANVLGHALMGLPNGNTILGMRLYTGVVVSVLAIFFYLTLRKKMPTVLVFAGEMIALSLCWCPTVSLYNYLTYFLMGIGIWLLYRGCLQAEGSRLRKWYLAAAGICLGANVTVRMPNVVQAAFILVLWYSAFLQKKTWKSVVRDTLHCVAGYLVGFGIPFISICVRYGISAYPAMVQNMFAMTEQAVDYKPSSMVTGILHDYRRGLYWFTFAAVCMAALYIVYGFYRIICKKRSAEHITMPEQVQRGTREKICTWIFRLMCIGVWCVLIRFYWGRGMFSFAYHNYLSVYWWAVLFVLTGIAGALWLIGSRQVSGEKKVLALSVLLQILLTPLGSNNWLYPIINNLFLAAPFTLWCCYLWFQKTNAGLRDVPDSQQHGKFQRNSIHFPWQSLLIIFGFMLCIQSIGFHRYFAFGDGVWGEKRDTVMTGIPKAEGIYTSRDNAECLSALAAFVKENELTGKGVILYGEIPGLSYLLDMPSAISTAWPDLDSNRLSQFEQDMESVEQHIDTERPVVIVATGIAAYYSGDEEAYEWFGVDAKQYGADQKVEILRQFLVEYGYEETFANMRYVVYE